jgi:dipeptide/tripeptide permease
LAAALNFVMFVRGGSGLPVMAMMCAFLLCATGRIVLSNTINSLTPAPEHRGRFMSLMSSSNQASSAIAMICAGNILRTAPSGALIHMDRIAWYAILATALSPVIATILAREIRAPRAAK